MEITLYKDGVEICLRENTIFIMTWDDINRVEQAIDIIRSMEEIAPIESASITIT